MRRILISTQNTLLSSLLLKMLKMRGNVQAERVTGLQTEDALINLCNSIKADVLLMEVSLIAPFTFAQRLSTASRIRAIVPDCKIALMCDENANPELGKSIALEKEKGTIDNFFFSSVSGEYLSAALEVM